MNWINSYLCKRKPPMKVENLIDDLRDGKIVIVKIFGTYKKFLELIQNILNLLKIFGTC